MPIEHKHWYCSVCGKDLGPAARHLRADKHFPWPCAYAGWNGKIHCGTCWEQQRKPTFASKAKGG